MRVSGHPCALSMYVLRSKLILPCVALLLAFPGQHGQLYLPNLVRPSGYASAVRSFFARVTQLGKIIYYATCFKFVTSDGQLHVNFARLPPMNGRFSARALTIHFSATCNLTTSRHLRLFTVFIIMRAARRLLCVLFSITCISAAVRVRTWLDNQPQPSLTFPYVADLGEYAEGATVKNTGLQESSLHQLQIKLERLAKALCVTSIRTCLRNSFAG
jgi:hypothetical protein